MSRAAVNAAVEEGEMPRIGATTFRLVTVAELRTDDRYGTGTMSERWRINFRSPRREQVDHQVVRQVHDRVCRLSHCRCYREYGGGSR